MGNPLTLTYGRASRWRPRPLPDPAGKLGAAPDHVDEADHQAWCGSCGWVERRAPGQGRQGKLLRTSKIRVDTTVVPSNEAYPTDSGLLAKAIRRIATTSRRIQAAGGVARTKIRDRSRSASKRAHVIGAGSSGACV